MTAAACAFCGVPVEMVGCRPRGRSGSRLDIEDITCDACVTLDPSRPGAALRAAARVLGAAEDDLCLHQALREDDRALDGLLFADRSDPLRSARPTSQRVPWAHVPQATNQALRRAQARAREFRALADRAGPAPAEVGPPFGPPGCLLCGVGMSPSWRRVLTAALTPGPEHVEGHLCAVCSRAYDRVGAVGPSLVARAFLEAAGLAWPSGVGLPVVRAWVATGLPPGEPWAWVDLRPPDAGLTRAELAAQVAELRSELTALRRGNAP